MLCKQRYVVALAEKKNNKKKQLNRRKQEQESRRMNTDFMFYSMETRVVYKQTRTALVYFMSVSRISGTLASSHARRLSERDRTTQGYKALDEEKHAGTETQHDYTPHKHDSRLRLCVQE